MNFPWRDMLIQPIEDMWSLLLTYIPKVVGAIVVLLIGWLIARAVQTIVDRILSKARFNTMTERAGINEALSQAQIVRPPSTIMARMFFWVVMLITLSTGVRVLNLDVASALLQRLTEYIPNVIAAAFILALGFFFGSLLQGFVSTLAGGIKIVNPQLLGQVARGAVVVFSVAASLEQLGVATTIVTTAFSVLLGSLGLGFAIAFGLGCQDIVRNWVNNALKS